jgi:O-acetyl-ADP-ribose deacetylase
MINTADKGDPSMKEKRLNGTQLQLSQGDITNETVDAIVNAANTHLRGGGGVDGAIHRAGGPEIMQECRAIGHCATGDAVITGGGKLSAQFVIHTAGPIYHGGDKGEADKLAGCYRRSLEVAVENQCASVAFPSISTGVYGYPVREAACIALKTVRKFLLKDNTLELVRFILFDEETFHAYAQALDKMDG